MKHFAFCILMILLVTSFSSAEQVFTDGDLSKYGGGRNSVKTDQLPQQDYGAQQEALAFDLCAGVIRRSLKTPSVAKIQTIGNGIVNKEHSIHYDRDSNIYTVFGSVDSQNSFGAMLTKKFYCKMYKDRGDWQIKDHGLF